MLSVTVRELTLKDAAALADLICHDTALREELGVEPGDQPSAESFLEHCREWARPRRATVMAIVVDEQAVGSITLGHRSEDGRSARIGCWIGTASRRQGIGTSAFREVLRMAAAEGVTSIASEIEAANLASRRIWERAGGRGTEISPGRSRYEIAPLSVTCGSADE
jgi:[ribosomal protein S5]-alanine N-acetyltransferase